MVLCLNKTCSQSLFTTNKVVEKTPSNYGYKHCPICDDILYYVCRCGQINKETEGCDCTIKTSFNIKEVQGFIGKSIFYINYKIITTSQYFGTRFKSLKSI